jgi:hypothetical protein
VRSDGKVGAGFIAFYGKQFLNQKVHIFNIKNILKKRKNIFVINYFLKFKDVSDIKYVINFVIF